MKQLFEKETIYDIAPFNKEAINEICTKESELLIICSKSDYDEHNELLLKISQAIGFEDASIINLDFDLGQYFPINELSQRFSSNQILSFGINPKTLGIPAHLKAHKQYQFENLSYCYTTSLMKMSSDQNIKKTFWTFAKQNLVNS